MKLRCLALSLTGLAWCLASAGAQPVRAQQALDRWETFASGDEVLALSVNPRLPTELWAGTEGGGVVVWDLTAAVGTKRFKQYLFPTTPGLDSNDVYDVAFDAVGDAWLATGTGVTQATGNNWRGFRAEDGLPPPPIMAVAVTGDGTVWAGSREGIAFLPPRGVRWTIVDVDRFVANDNSPKIGPGATRVADMAVDREDQLWVVHGSSQIDQPATSIFESKTGRWRHITAGGPQGDTSRAPRTEQLLSVSTDEVDGTVWFGSQGRGVISYDGPANLWKEWDDGPCRSTVWAVKSGAGQVWATCAQSSSAKNVVTYDGRAWQSFDSSNGLNTEVVTAYAMASGRVYLGSNGTGSTASEIYGYGIMEYDGRSFLEPLSTFPYTPITNDITAVLALPDGKVWVGTRGKGLLLFDGQTWERFTRDGTSARLTGDMITDLALRDGHELWVSSTSSLIQGGRYVDGGVGIYDLQSQVWQNPLPIKVKPEEDGIPDTDVASLAIAEDGQVWIGFGAATGGVGERLNGGNGVVIYDPRGNRWLYDTRVSTGDQLRGDTVLGLAADAQDVWAATSYADNGQATRVGGGVSRHLGLNWTGWSGGEQGLRTFHGSGNNDPLISGDVRSVAIDPAGRALAGSYDLDSGDLSTRWPRVDAVINRNDGGQWDSHLFPGSGWVSAIVVDKLQQVWAGTTRGHTVTEFSPAGSIAQWDTAVGGIFIWSSGDFTSDASWAHIAPPISGVASKSITALDLEKSSGAMWVGTENGGVSVYRGNSVPVPTNTPCPNCTPSPTPPTATPRPDQPTPTATTSGGEPVIGPIATSAGGGGGGGNIGDEDEDEPDAPPEVPEAATWLLLGAGLAGMAAYARRRQTQ